MKVILLSVCIGMLLVVGACSNEEKSPPSTTKTSSSSTSSATPIGIAAGDVMATLSKTSDRVFQFTLKNQTEKPVTFTYSSGQRFDYDIKNSQGETVYQYGSEQVFIEAVSSETLKQAEERTYTIDTSRVDLPHDTYTLTVRSTDNAKKTRQATTTFVVK